MSKNPSPSGSVEHSDTETELFPPSRTKCLFCKPKAVRPCSVSYHRFPRRPEMSDVWARKSGMKHVLKASLSKRYKTFRVCSLHFKDSDYVDRIRGRLYPSAVPSRTENDIAVPPRVENNINIDLSEMKKSLRESLTCRSPTTEAETNNTTEGESNTISEDAVSGNAKNKIFVPLTTRKQSSTVNPDIFVDLTFEVESNNISDDVVSESEVSSNTLTMSASTSKLNRTNPSFAVTHESLNLTFGVENDNISKAESNTIIKAASNHINANAVTRNNESPRTIPVPFTTSKPNRRKQSFAVTRDSLDPLIVEEKKIPQLKIVLFKKKAQKRKLKNRKSESS